MSAEKKRLLYKKQKLPLSVSALCSILSRGCQLVSLYKNKVLSEIVVSDNGSIVRDCLFIPYEETDDFCRDTIKRGAAVVLTDHEIEGVPCILVDSIADALYDICAWMFDSIRLPSIVVCGSEGKTTTKRILSEVLQTEKQVFYEAGNYNTFQALCCSLQRIQSGAELIVQEVDEKRSNGTRNCSAILKPKIALVTNIAEAHLGAYGSIEALTESFRGITAGMDENGVVIINGDDANSVNAHFDAKVIRVGIYDTSCECVASNLREGRLGVEFDVCYAGETEHIQLSIHGEHNVYNAMMAYVAGKLEGISTANIKKGLLSYRNTGIRQNICSIGDTLIYADCYNASATSVRFALKCFDELPSENRKKVAVLGDIAEIEGFEEDTYRRIAAALDETGVDVLVTCGKDSEMIHSFITRDMVKKHTQNLNELNAYLRTLKKDGGNYLYKASRIMTLEKSIQSVFPNHYAKLTGQQRGLKTTAKRVLSKVKRSLIRRK